MVQQLYTTLRNGVQMPLLGLGVYDLYGKDAETNMRNPLTNTDPRVRNLRLLTLLQKEELYRLRPTKPWTLFRMCLARKLTLIQLLKHIVRSLLTEK